MQQSYMFKIILVDENGEDVESMDYVLPKMKRIQATKLFDSLEKVIFDWNRKKRIGK